LFFWGLRCASKTPAPNQNPAGTDGPPRNSAGKDPIPGVERGWGKYFEPRPPKPLGGGDLSPGGLRPSEEGLRPETRGPSSARRFCGAAKTVGCRSILEQEHGLSKNGPSETGGDLQKRKACSITSGRQPTKPGGSSNLRKIGSRLKAEKAFCRERKKNTKSGVMTREIKKGSPIPAVRKRSPAGVHAAEPLRSSGWQKRETMNAINAAFRKKVPCF